MVVMVPVLASSATKTEQNYQIILVMMSHLAINLLLLQPALGSSFVELFLDDGEEVLAFSIMGNK